MYCWCWETEEGRRVRVGHWIDIQNAKYSQYGALARTSAQILFPREGSGGVGGYSITFRYVGRRWRKKGEHAHVKREQLENEQRWKDRILEDLWEIGSRGICRYLTHIWRLQALFSGLFSLELPLPVRGHTQRRNLINLKGIWIRGTRTVIENGSSSHLERVLWASH